MPLGQLKSQWMCIFRFYLGVTHEQAEDRAWERGLQRRPTDLNLKGELGAVAFLSEMVDPHEPAKTFRANTVV